jgi:hypothetical protein
MTVVKRTDQRLIEDDFLRDGDKIYILKGTKANIFCLKEHAIFGKTRMIIEFQISTRRLC